MSEFTDMSGAKIAMADSNLVEKYRDKVEVILWAVANVKGWGDIDDVFVSDMSSLGDFQLSDAQLRTIQAVVGFPIKAQHLIYEIAAKMGGTEADA